MARLLILWLLAEQPMHGYQIKKSLTDDGMGFWFGLEDASIYSVLRTLAKHGYARELAMDQDGNRPQRTKYAITAAGRAYYRQLLLEAWASAPLPVAALDVALAAGGDLKPAEITKAVATRTTRLTELLTEIEQHAAAAPAGAIVTRNAAIVTAELAWLSTLDPTTLT